MVELKGVNLADLQKKYEQYKKSDFYIERLAQIENIKKVKKFLLEHDILKKSDKKEAFQNLMKIFNGGIGLDKKKEYFQFFGISNDEILNLYSSLDVDSLNDAFLFGYSNLNAQGFIYYDDVEQAKLITKFISNALDENYLAINKDLLEIEKNNLPKFTPVLISNFLTCINNEQYYILSEPILNSLKTYFEIDIKKNFSDYLDNIPKVKELMNSFKMENFAVLDNFLYYLQEQGRILELWAEQKSYVMNRLSENEGWTDALKKALVYRNRDLNNLSDEDIKFIWFTHNISNITVHIENIDYKYFKEAIKILSDKNEKYFNRIIKAEEYLNKYTRNKIKPGQLSQMFRSLIIVNPINFSLINKEHINKVLKYFFKTLSLNSLKDSSLDSTIKNLNFVVETISHAESAINDIDKFKILWYIKDSLEEVNAPTNVEEKEIQKQESIEVKMENKLLEKKKQVILYGPAGTGKTYSVKEIISNFDYLKSEGKLKFVTFHQSFAYEEFIEGIKPKLDSSSEENKIEYEIVNGIFKDICESAILNAIEKNPNLLVEQKKISANFKKLFNILIENIESNLVKYSSRSEIRINENENIEIYLLDGKRPEKPYIISKNRLEKLYNNKDKIKNTVNDIRDIIGGCNYTLYKFILDELVKNEKNIDENYLIDKDDKLIRDKLLKNFYELPRNERENAFKDSDKFYLIIDEINRGNISKIFGELITLLEASKRLGEKDEIITELPYSYNNGNSKFGVPPNLFIIGTMNTSDKSLASLDIALRRRFGFHKMLPNYELKELSWKFNGENNLGELLKSINARIELLIDQDHVIGHSYFCDIDSIESLEFCFYDEVIPLLEEYFFNDIKKIRFIIGDDFYTERIEDFSKLKELDNNNLIDENNLFRLNRFKGQEFINILNKLLK